MNRLPSILEFLEMCGFEFELDYDDELIITAPTELDPQKIRQWLWQKHDGHIVSLLKLRAEVDRWRLVGGPCHGRRHWKDPGDYVVHRVARAKWSVYKVWPDGRAVFCGYASSEKKARRGELSPTPNP